MGQVFESISIGNTIRMGTYLVEFANGYIMSTMVLSPFLPVSNSPIRGGTVPVCDVSQFIRKGVVVVRGVRL